MSQDPMDAMFDIDLNSSAYSDLLNEAGRDDREGDQEFMVTGTVRDQWPQEYGGGPRAVINGVLASANSAKFNFTWSPPPPDAEEEAARRKQKQGTWDAAKVQAVASSIKLARQLSENYGIASPASIPVGTTIKVKLVKNKKGYLRLIQILPKDAALGTDTVNGGGGTPPASPF